ncbi:MAG: hypothetical protein ABI899_04145 [Actinomycetota bacterium]
MNDPDPLRASDGFDQDAIFADIVAHLDGDEADPDAELMTWTDQASVAQTAPETADDQPPEDDRQPVDEPPALPEPGYAQALPAPQVWRAHAVDDEQDEHFEPQPVAPLPVGDLQFWAIILGMCGGPLLLLYLVLFNRDAGGLWILAAIGMSVGGFVLLVSRLPGNQGDDDGARL